MHSVRCEIGSVDVVSCICQDRIRELRAEGMTDLEQRTMLMAEGYSRTRAYKLVPVGRARAKAAAAAPVEPGDEHEDGVDEADRVTCKCGV